MAEEHEHDEHDLGDDEIEITINPREEDRLDALGVGPEQFEAAAVTTLDAYDRKIDLDDPDAVAPLEEAEITLNGTVYHLREVADIEITGGLDAPRPGRGGRGDGGRSRVNPTGRPKSGAESGCQVVLLGIPAGFAYHRWEPTPSAAPRRRPGAAGPFGMGDATPPEPATPHLWSPDEPATEAAGLAPCIAARIGRLNDRGVRTGRGAGRCRVRVAFF